MMGKRLLTWSQIAYYLCAATFGAIGIWWLTQGQLTNDRKRLCFEMSDALFKAIMSDEQRKNPTVLITRVELYELDCPPLGEEKRQRILALDDKQGSPSETDQKILESGMVSLGLRVGDTVKPGTANFSNVAGGGSFEKGSLLVSLNRVPVRMTLPKATMGVNPVIGYVEAGRCFRLEEIYLGNKFLYGNLKSENCP